MSEENQSNETPMLEGMILTTQGNPFKNAETANKKRLELISENPDKSFSMIGFNGGYALIETIKTQAELKAEEDLAARLKSGQEPPDDGKSDFVRVIFDAKSDVTEPDDVFLMHNGDPLWIQREVEITIPRKYLEVADNTLRQKFRQLPNQPRKTIAHIKTFTYRVLGPGKREEYEAMKRAGNEALKASVMQNQ